MNKIILSLINFIKSIKRYFTDIIDVTGYKLFILLTITQFFIKGAQYALVSKAFFPVLRYLEIEPAKIQILLTVISIPWGFKPLFGIISDLVPIGGYNKRYYHLIITIISIFMAILLYLFGTYNITIVIMGFFGYNFQTALCDLLNEGQYSELMRDFPHIRTNIITFVQILNTLGSIFLITILGPILQYSNSSTEISPDPFFILYGIGLFISITPLPVFAWYQEKKIYSDKNCNFITIEKHKWRKHRKILIFICITGLFSPIAVFIANFSSLLNGMIFSIITLILCISIAFLILPNNIAKITLFIMLMGLNKPYLGSALDYFYTANNYCFENGPAFDYEYYLSWTGTLGYVFQMIGAIVYQFFFYKFKYRNVLILTIILSSIAGLTDLIMVLRWNISIGISDKVFYMFGSAILGNLTFILWYIPVFSIVSSVCPPGLEATLFAFMVGVYNFADQLNYINGSLLYELAGITCTCKSLTTVLNNDNNNNNDNNYNYNRNNSNSSNSSNSELCNFDNLWILIISCYIISPLIVGIPATFLIPNLHQTDILTKDEDTSLLTSNGFD